MRESSKKINRGKTEKRENILQQIYKNGRSLIIELTPLNDPC
jgi:hypothetical protein